MSPEREGDEERRGAAPGERAAEGKEPDRDQEGEIGEGLTEEFEAEFGQGFGADLGDEPHEEPDPVTGAETVEADVLALADAEEERERELREADEEEAPEEEAPEEEEEEEEEEAPEQPANQARAAEDGAPSAAVAPPAPPATAAPPPPPATVAPPAPPTAVAARYRAPQPPGAAGEAPETAGEGDEAPRSGLWLRFLAASFVIVVSMATATSVTLLLYLSDIAAGLGGIKGVQSKLATVEGGAPQTLLILGSDKRADEPTARSDTTMLLRIDPDRDAIALFSLPRDLKVNIPGRGVDRLNAAYTIGGPKLTLKTIKQLTGLEINHLVNVDFAGFYRAVNAIDCVYVDVDRHYFHSNAGLPAELQFAEINVKAGYQRLCGTEALEYVRYRHTDNDLVRAARQQDFLREARQKISPLRVWRDRRELMGIFTRYTTSDIDDEFELLDLIETFVAARNATVKEIHFEGELGRSYVTSSVEQMRQAVDDFLGTEDTLGGPAGKKRGGGEGGEKPSGGGGQPPPSGGGGANLIDAAAAGEPLAQRFSDKLEFPVYRPTRLAPGSELSGDSRSYKIVGPEEEELFPAYKLVITRPSAFGFDEYYGVMGTSWEDPPILENPSETREIGGREYLLFYDGDRVRLVGWKTRQASYWINNTLLQELEEEEMLGIAQSMRTPGK